MKNGVGLFTFTLCYADHSFTIISSDVNVDVISAKIIRYLKIISGYLNERNLRLPSTKSKITTGFLKERNLRLSTTKYIVFLKLER